MPYFTLLRGVAVLAVYALKGVLSPAAYMTIYVSVLLGHYWIAFLRGRDILFGDFSADKALRIGGLLVFAMTVGGATLFSSNILPIYFSLHFAFSECYILAQSGLKNFVPLRILLNLFLYFTVLSPTFGVNSLWFCIPLGACFAFYAGSLLLHNRRLDRNTLDLFLFELAGVVIGIALCNGSVKFYDVIFYHLTVWFIYGLQTADRTKAVGLTGPRVKYLLETVFYTGILSLIPLFVPRFWCEKVGAILGAVHVSISFASSVYNPVWIMKLLLAKRRSLPAAAPVA